MDNGFFISRFCTYADTDSLKELWHICFGDAFSDIDVYFNTAFSPGNSAVIECNGKIVSMVLLPESSIVYKGKIRKAVYFYAVCTHPDYRNKGFITSLFDFAEKELKKRNVEILFLVPENRELLKMYGKFGFCEFCFPCEKLTAGVKKAKQAELTFEIYKQIKLKQSNSFPVNIWNEKEFSYFLNSPFSTCVCVKSENNYGYFLYNDENEITEWGGSTELFDFCAGKFGTAKIPITAKYLSEPVLPSGFYFGNPT